MTETTSRRGFLQQAVCAATAAGAALALRGQTEGGEFAGRIKKAVRLPMVAGNLSLTDKFKLLADLGFDGVEICRRGGPDPKQAARASEVSGLAIHGVSNGSGADIADAIDEAKLYGATSVLLVAGRVDQKTSYDANYRASQELIRAAIPHAEKCGVDLLVENVWNYFLQSPLEMARYVDELDSPRVGAYFDVGNVVCLGWPEQWIRILGKRVRKIHVKEYSRKKMLEEGKWKGFQGEIGEGDCGWPEVRKALADVGFSGWATAEVPGGDRNRLAEVAQRMDKVLDL